jgi:hypothetical protein
MVDELLGLEQTEDGVRVSDVDDEQHGITNSPHYTENRPRESQEKRVRARRRRCEAFAGSVTLDVNGGCGDRPRPPLRCLVTVDVIVDVIVDVDDLVASQCGRNDKERFSIAPKVASTAGACLLTTCAIARAEVRGISGSITWGTISSGLRRAGGWTGAGGRWERGGGAGSRRASIEGAGSRRASVDGAIGGAVTSRRAFFIAVEGDSRSSSPANAASSGDGRAGLRPGGNGASAGSGAVMVSLAVGALGASGGVERRGRGGS